MNIGRGPASKEREALQGGIMRRTKAAVFVSALLLGWAAGPGHAGERALSTPSAPPFGVLENRATRNPFDVPGALRALPLSPFPGPSNTVAPAPQVPERKPAPPRHRGRDVIIIQSPVYVAAPRAECWAPGYWTYHWVPQVGTSAAWVPGHWAPGGRWIDGHYASQTWSTGYWQPVWTADAWTC